MNQESGESTAVETPKNDHEDVFQPTPEAPAPAETPKVEADSEEDTDQSDKADKPKRRGGFQKKIERLTEENARLRVLAERQPQAPVEKPDNATSGKPVQNDYQTYDDYIEALTDWKANQATEKKLGERDKKAKEVELSKERETKVKSYNTQAEEARKTYDDFDDVIAEFDDTPVNPAIHSALLDSDLGAEVAYYLAKNPEEFDKLNSPTMGEAQVSRMIGRIEARIEVGKKSGEQKAAVKTTQAPPPITPVKTTAKTANTPEAAAASGDYEAYKKARGIR